MDFKIVPVGDSALTIVFGNKIDPEISRAVRIARKYLTKREIEGVNEYVQTYATLMVHYRPVEIGYHELAERIETELNQIDFGGDRLKKKTILIPVCYGGEFGQDLGGMDHAISTPRLKDPRERLEKGSVGIAGDQTGIYPMVSPGGWQIIGRTPLNLYDHDREKPILYEAGEFIRFVPVTEERFREIEKQEEEHVYEYRWIREE